MARAEFKSSSSFSHLQEETGSSPGCEMDEPADWLCAQGRSEPVEVSPPSWAGLTAAGTQAAVWQW